MSLSSDEFLVILDQIPKYRPLCLSRSRARLEMKSLLVQDSLYFVLEQDILSTA